jgi:16S rRNA processing protein RimM
VVLGRVLGAFGIHGWIKVRPFTESPDGLLSQPAWVLGQAGALRTVRVLAAREHGASVLARLEGVDDRGQAELLRGADVKVARDQLPTAEEGEYYWSDLIGLLVRNVNGVSLGRVTGLISAPAHDVLRVAADGTESALRQGGERLIPFVEPILRVVDLPGRCITVDWEADY